MKRLQLLILPIFFFGFIYFMAINQYFGWIKLSSSSENRALAAKPTFDIRHLDDYPVAFDKYLEDNYYFRAPFLQAYHEMKFRFGISPNDHDVLIGKEGHYFLAQKDQEIFEGKHYFDDQKMEQLIQIWSERMDYFTKHNIPFYWIIAPNKHNVYPELLPNNLRVKFPNRTEPIVNKLNQQLGTFITYALSPIQNAKEKEKAYFKHDNHWNHYGASYGYDALMQLIQKKQPSIQSINRTSYQWKTATTTGGNLLNFIGKDGELKETYKTVHIPHSNAQEAARFNFTVPDYFPYPWEYEMHFTNDKALNQQRVLIIRDSYGEYIMPFINATFSETLYIFDSWHYALDKEIIERYKPDLVIYLSYEVHLDNLLEHPAIIEGIKNPTK